MQSVMSIGKIEIGSSMALSRCPALSPRPLAQTAGITPFETLTSKALTTTFVTKSPLALLPHSNGRSYCPHASECWLKQ